MVTQEILDQIKRYFFMGFSYRLIHYLLQKNHRSNISFNCLRRRILPTLNLRRRQADINIDDFEINNGCSGAENLRRILKMKYHLNVTRSISREIVNLLDEDGVKRRKQRRLRRRQYFSKGPNYVWHLDGYDKLKPYGISIHGCIDGFSRRIIWLEAEVTNKRPEVVAEYYLNAVHELKGCPCKIRADPGTENGIVATIHSYLKDNTKSVTLGTSTANQRIERFWGILRQMKADFWMHHFKGLVYDDLLLVGNPLHRLCIQYVYLPLIKRDLKEIKEMWNIHSIRRQKMGDTVTGIPDVLFKNPEIVGASQFLFPVSEDTIGRLQRMVENNFKQVDEDFIKVALSVIEYYGISPPDVLTDLASARHLYTFLIERISFLFLA